MNKEKEIGKKCFPLLLLLSPYSYCYYCIAFVISLSSLLFTSQCRALAYVQCECGWGCGLKQEERHRRRSGTGFRKGVQVFLQRQEKFNWSSTF